jgi:hypothetical protein
MGTHIARCIQNMMSRACLIPSPPDFPILFLLYAPLLHAAIDYILFKHSNLYTCFYSLFAVILIVPLFDHLSSAILVAQYQ